jgi:hypothetical protein
MNEDDEMIYIKIIQVLSSIIVGESLSITCILLSIAYTIPEFLSITPLTIFPHMMITYWGVIVIPFWIIVGMILFYGFIENGMANL